MSNEILNHFLIPKAEIVSEEEKRKLLGIYGESLKQFPKIKESDPLVKALGAKVGDIIKVYRENPIIKNHYSIYYRVVVKSK